MRRRGHVIPLRLNEREYRHLCEQVKIRGFSREEYLRSLISVSYTHLDVYKRQLPESTQHRFRVCGNRTVAQPYAQA